MVSYCSLVHGSYLSPVVGFESFLFVLFGGNVVRGSYGCFICFFMCGFELFLQVPRTQAIVDGLLCAASLGRSEQIR